ncbi:major facilitator superfamily MFS_1 [Shewanella denitrificans OS217]|jgi:predicted MFS family arabinose efflux permease|uniref:Major facilitator superfamily MFS_1 n=1 Tax=Shewanella denitrificans (strain OS217 / ATCC BAA-1090 / DSM 15013) TaxID=318161 RepID=Q12II0_SHEDO|nr:MFS transporter [Shewanella denitrificans]ABE56746.1 major facilitator superfamily MFS_1 [Shewanella denitrificans OS217]
MLAYYFGKIMFALLFENLNFSRFLIGRFLALTSDQLLLFAIPLIVYRNTGSITQSGLVFFLEWLPRVISLPIAGTLADRFGGRVLFLVSDLVRGISCLLAAFMLLNYNQYSFYILSLLAIVNAFFQAQSLIAVESLVPRLFEQSKLIQVQSMLQALMQLSMIFGPIVCGVLVLVMDKSFLLLVAAIVYLLCVCNTFSLGFEQPLKSTDSGKKVSIFEQLRLASNLIYRQPKLKRLTCESMTINLLLGVMLGLASIIAISKFNVTDQTFSLLQLALGAASVVALSFSSQVFSRFDGMKVFLCSIWLVFGGCLIAAIASEFWVFTLGYSVMIAALAFFNVYMRAERVKLIPADDRGKVIGIMVMFNQLPLPIAGVLIAVFSESVGPQNLILMVIAINCLIYLLSYFLIRVRPRSEVHESTK